jgi:hypothetical protein
MQLKQMVIYKISRRKNRPVDGDECCGGRKGDAILLLAPRKEPHTVRFHPSLFSGENTICLYNEVFSSP